MRRIPLTLAAVLGLLLSATGAGAFPNFDPPGAANGSADDTSHASPNIRFVKNIPYTEGYDVEFAELTVTVLDELGNPVCETDAEGNCLVDEDGNVIYQTEQRDYAFAGASGGTRVVDITDPEEASVAAHIDCATNPGDVQVRPDLGLLAVSVDSNTTTCGMAGSRGVLLFDVSDPRSPRQVGTYTTGRGAHNLAFHPTAPLLYLADAEATNTGLGKIPIVDVSDPANPALVRTVDAGAQSPHDISFNASGTRAYAASFSRTDIWNTTDPRNPVLISSVYDPTLNALHAAATPNGRYLVVSEELADGVACAGGGLRFFDISNEQVALPVSVFHAEETGQEAFCTARTFGLTADGRTLTVGWGTAGTRVVDIADPRGPGAVEIAHFDPSGLGGNTAAANSWASKMHEGYIYSSDSARGLDIMRWLPAVPAAPPAARSVIALLDTGINPYHQEFRWDSPLAFQHPSTYIPGYPEDAIALPITLDQPDYWKAVKKDCNTIWKNVQTGKLYWFPGTKIIGGISFGAVTGMTNCAPAQPTGGKILDTGGHGTMTASRAAANTYGACRECLIVSLSNPMTASLGPANTQQFIDPMKFAADNRAWIDAQSHSWGPIVFPGWEPTGQAGLFVSSPAFVRAVEEVSQKHLAFWASGNGLVGRFGVLGSPTLLTPSLTPSAIAVGGHDSGYVNIWPGFPPHVVSDSCAAWAADHRSTTRSTDSIASGTSGATPFAAGGAARILMQARTILGQAEDTGVATDGVTVAAGPAGLVPGGPLADGRFTLAEWKELVFKTASPRPRAQFEDGPPCGLGLYGPTTVKWEEVPPGYPEYVHIGYGAIDDPARDRAFDVLAGNAPMPDRTVTDAYFAADGAARLALHQVYRGGPT